MTGGSPSRGVVFGDAGATSFLFAGEYVDPAGMYYLRSREFDPRSGVFLSVDPVLSATGMPYAYTAGNPLQGTDPLGLYGLGDLWDDAGSVAGGVWEEVSSPEFLVSAVVGIGCVAVFGPAGVVGCAAAAGAVHNAMDYSLNTPGQCQSLGGYFKTVAIGGVEGAVIGAVTGPVARPIAGVLNRVLGPLVPSVMRESVSSVFQPAKNALQRLGNAFKPRLATAESAADDALAPGRTSGAASELKAGGQTFIDVSTGGGPRALHTSVQEALDAVPMAQRAPWHGYCAEMGCLSQAMYAGVNPAGGSIRAVAIGTSNPGHGLPKVICTSCSAVLDRFGVGR